MSTSLKDSKIPTLARRLGLVALIIYGIGDILGAGIYALVGKVIGLAGPGAWVTFVLAALVALVTGFSYAELTGRYPVSAGAAAFVRRAFPGKFIALFTGIIVLGTGLASAATVSVAFSHYLVELVALPPLVGKLILIGFISFLSFWGIHESSRVNMVLTAIEFSGLVAVIIVGAGLLSGADWSHFIAANQTNFEWSGVFAGVTIAFYAYIGFEDLANLAEECKNPSSDLPRAILTAIGVTTVIYLAVTLVLLLTVPQNLIGESKTPLLLVFEQAGLHQVLHYFSLVALLAITNTGLINLIMGSRLLYGMAHEGLVPKVLGKVHHKRRTPWVGVLVSTLIVVLLVFTGGLKVLAQTTSLLILMVFFLVHLSLLRVKQKRVPYRGIHFPAWLPLVGALMTLALMTQFPAGVYARSILLVGIAFVVWLGMREKKNKT